MRSSERPQLNIYWEETKAIALSDDPPTRSRPGNRGQQRKRANSDLCNFSSGSEDQSNGFATIIVNQKFPAHSYIAQFFRR